MSWKYKFTPTPWTLLDYGYGYKIEPEICWIGENGRTTKEQLKANANLLLAAPDMFKKLEELRIKLFDMGFPEEEIEEINQITKKALGIK